MAFPTIPTVAAGRVQTATQLNNSGTRTFPSLSTLTKNSGDLLIAICVGYQSAAASGSVFSAWGAGFTEFLDTGGGTGQINFGAAYKWSTGSETGTFTVTQAGAVTGHAAMILLSISGAHATTPPEAGAGSLTQTIFAADIPALDPAGWGTQDTLWIAVGGCGETSTAGSFTGITAGPTNYTGYVDTFFSDVTGGVEAAVAFRQRTAASEDILIDDGFVVDISNARNAGVLLAVRPAATERTVTQAQETDSAQTVSGTIAPQARNITLVTETDSVGQIVAFQPLPATEADSGQPLSTQGGRSITTATTTASAQALNVDKAVTITPASETDAAISSGRTLTYVVETDAAQPLSASRKQLTPVTETDLAGDIVELQPLPALETDSPQVLVATQSGRSLTPATSTAQAQLLSFTQGGGRTIAPATETDLANTIVSLRPLPATTTASAQALQATYGGKNIAFVQESDSARPIASGAGVNLPEFEASVPFPYNQRVAVGDLSTVVALSVTVVVGGSKSILPATETNTAQALTVQKGATITRVSTTDAPQAVTNNKTLGGIAPATTTTTVRGLSYTQGGSVHYVIDPVVDTNTALDASRTKLIFMTLGIVTSLNTARFTRAANRPTGGLALIDHEPATGLTLTDHTQTEDLAFIDI